MKREHSLLKLSWTLLVCVNAFALCANASEMLLVSIHQYGYIKEQPCVVYRLNTGESGLYKYAEIPVAGGTRMTEVSPDGRYLVVWQYAGQRSDRFPLGQGQLTIMDLASPETRVEIPLPFRPVRGGYLRQDPELGLEVVTLGIGDINPAVYSWNKKRILSSLETDFVWEDVMFRGKLTLNDDLPSDSSGNLRFTEDPESGSLKAFPSGPLKKPYKSRVKLDSTTKGLLIPRSGEELLLSSTNTEVAVYQVAGRSPDKGQVAQALVFDKARKSWSSFSPMSPESNFLLFGPWIIERTNELVRTQANPSAKVRTKKLGTGNYIFYTRAGQRQFDWNPGADALLIGVLDGRLIYRIENSVHEIPVRGETGVESQSDRVVAQDERLSRVYWALPVPAE